MKTFLIDQLPLFRMCPRLSIGTAKPGTKTIANFAHFADDLGKIIFIKRLFCHNISTWLPTIIVLVNVRLIIPT